MARWINDLKNVTFKRRLLLYSILLSIIPVFVLGTLSAHIASSTIQNEVNQNHQNTLRQIINQVDLFMKNLENSSIQIASDIIIVKSVRLGISMDDLERLNTTMDMVEMIGKYRSYSDINFGVSLVYHQYGYVYSNNYGGLISQKEYPFSQLVSVVDPNRAGSVIIPPNTYPNQEDLMLLRKIPINSQSTDGVLVLQIDKKELYNFFQSLNLGNKTKIIVLDNDGRIVMSDNTNDVGTRLTINSNLYRFWEKPESFRESYILDHKKYNLSSHTSSFNNWVYITMTPTEELLRKANNIKYLTWFMVFMLAAAWGLLSFIGSQRMYFPIHQMTLKLPKSLNKDGLKALDLYISDVVENNENLQSQISQQLPHLQKNIVLRLLHGEITEEEFLQSRTQYHLALDGNWFYTCVLKVDQYIALKKNYIGKDRSLIMYSLTKMVEEISGELYFCATVSPQVGEVALIIGVEQPDEHSAVKIEQLCDLIREKVDEYFQFTVKVAISHAHKGYMNISEGYQEALELLNLRLLLDSNITITPQKVGHPDLMKQSGRVIVKSQKSIVKCIAEGEIDQAEKHFVDMCSIIARHVFSSVPIIGLFTHLIGEIDHVFEDKGHELSQFFDYNIYDKLYTASSIEEVEHWFHVELFPALKHHLGNLNESNKQKLVEQAAAFIHENYETDLSLQQVADQFNVSTYQLSRAFKEEKGINFVEYLINFRMSKAKEWLVHTDQSIKEISERLCYTNTQNFSRVFKQITGIPPGKYRSHGRGDHGLYM